MRQSWLDGAFVTAGAGPELDGTRLFETLRVVRGKVGLWRHHRQRVRSSAVRLGLAVPPEDLVDVFAELAQRNQIEDGRGRIGEGVDRLVVTLEPVDTAPDPLELSRAEISWPQPGFKWTDRRALQNAEARAGGEVVLSGSGGSLFEASRSNLFVLGEHGIETAPPPLALPGVARAALIELAHAHALPVALRPLIWSERARWKAVFVTNALRGLRAVRAIDEHVCPPLEPDGPIAALRHGLHDALSI